MDVVKYLAVLFVFLVDGGSAGGHGKKHHDHVRLYVPEFNHHDHHTKVVTIHHHHHKPKKEHHHHHHHHHHKPHVPYGHHYHHHKKVHHTKTESKGHHGHHGHHHKHHGHHGHHGHHHHGHHHHDSPSYYGPQHDIPSVSYDPIPTTTFEEDFNSHFSPSYGGGVVPRTPHVHGVTHTVKQVKVFDSLPGAIPNVASNSVGGGGYQVTEEGEDEDDSFTSIDGLQQSYPATFGYVRNAAPEVVSNDVFSSLAPQATLQSAKHDPFADSPAPTAFSGTEFTSPAQAPFSSIAPTQNVHPSAQSAPEFPAGFQAAPTGFDDPANAFVGADARSTALAPQDQDRPNGNDVVSYSRVAGIQQVINTGGVESVVY